MSRSSVTRWRSQPSGHGLGEMVVPCTDATSAGRRHRVARSYAQRFAIVEEVVGDLDIRAEDYSRAWLERKQPGRPLGCGELSIRPEEKPTLVDDAEHSVIGEQSMPSEHGSARYALQRSEQFANMRDETGFEHQLRPEDVGIGR